MAINLWYHVGSKNEERSQRGFTHLFEHLMFEGSEHYPGDFFKHLQPLGANINGSTSSDRTNYFVDLPTAHAELAIAMESDRMANLLGALDEQKLRIQKDVVKNEYRQNYANRPYGMVWRLIAEALYPPQHPYSWLTIGVMEDVERATMEDVSAFFRRFYVPSNASLAVVGDLDEDRAIALAERYFGPIPGGTPALRPWAPAVELAERSRDRRSTIASSSTGSIWSGRRSRISTTTTRPLLLLGDILARGRSSRLYRKLVIEEQIAQDVTAYQSGRELAGSFGIVVTLRPSRSIERGPGAWSTPSWPRSRRRRSTDEELRRVQNLRVAGFFFALEHIGGFGGVADRLNAYNVFRGDPGLIATDVQRFREVTPEAIRRGRSAAYRRQAARRAVGRRPEGTDRASARRSIARSRRPAPSRSGFPRPMPRDPAAAVRDSALGLPAARPADRRRARSSSRGAAGSSRPEPSRPGSI